MDRARAGRRGDGDEVVGEQDLRKRRRVLEQTLQVCQPQYDQTSLCSCSQCSGCGGRQLNTWAGWDEDGVKGNYCWCCWVKFFNGGEGDCDCHNCRPRTIVRDPDSSLGDPVPNITQTLRGLKISSTGGSSEASGSSSASRGTSTISRPGRVPVLDKSPASPNLPGIEEVSDSELESMTPMTVVPSKLLQAAMKKNRGGGSRGGGDVE